MQQGKTIVMPIREDQALLVVRVKGPVRVDLGRERILTIASEHTLTASTTLRNPHAIKIEMVPGDSHTVSASDGGVSIGGSTSTSASGRGVAIGVHSGNVSLDIGNQSRNGDEAQHSVAHATAEISSPKPGEGTILQVQPSTYVHIFNGDSPVTFTAAATAANVQSVTR